MKKKYYSGPGAYWAPESISKDHLDIWGLEMVLDDKYICDVVFKSCAGLKEKSNFSLKIIWQYTLVKTQKL